MNLSTHSIDSNTTPSSAPDCNLPQSACHAHPYLSGCSGTPIDSDKSSSLNSSRSSLPVWSVNSEGSGLFANCSYPQLNSYMDNMISELSLTESQSSDLHQLAAVSQLTIDHCTIFIYFMFSGGSHLDRGDLLLRLQLSATSYRTQNMLGSLMDWTSKHGTIFKEIKQSFQSKWTLSECQNIILCFLLSQIVVITN